MHLPSRLILLVAVAAFSVGVVACFPSKSTATPTRAPIASGNASVPVVAPASAGATTSTDKAPTATPTPGTVVPPAATGTRYAFTCEANKKFEAVFFPAAQEKATLVLDGKTLELKQERSASGVRYSDGGTLVLSTKGAEAFIEQGGTQTYKACTGAPVTR